MMRWEVVILCAAVVGCAREGAPASPGGNRTALASARVKSETLVNEVAGRLSTGQVRSFVRAHEGDVRACYESEARADPVLQGGIVLSWEILPDGSVSAPMLTQSTLDNSRVEECVLRHVRGWRFPASESQTSVARFSLRFPL